MFASHPILWFHPSRWPWFVYVWVLWAAGILGARWRKPFQRWFRRTRASEWPTAPGRIDFTYVRSTGSRRSISLIAELDYSYAAEGQNFSGKYEREFYIEPEAREFVRELQGKSVSVSYNPRKLASSTLTNDAVKSLLNLRVPVPEVLRLEPFALDTPGWSKPLLWPLMALSLIGLILSLWVHIGALAGRRVAPEALFFILHIGIFALWLPAILIAQKRIGNLQRKDFWKAVTSGAPEWIRYTVYGFGIYALVNFAIFMVHAPPDGTSGPLTPEMWRGFSGHWMVFYSAAFAIFYSATVSPKSTAEARRSIVN
ncbi:MAG TPA: DUF3592 domain-containing protein [Acidobacteriaceae bacterium]|nr:DUF3592 domain-containing protein [Acidobacteriaceae bacterium]